jgi:hypothetical protein
MIKYSTTRKLLVPIVWLVSVAAAFVGGAYFRIAYYVYPSPIHSYIVGVNGAPSPDGMRYSAKGIAEANSAAKNLISEAGLRRRNFNPEFIVTPELFGYTVHLVSGTDGSEFPSDLLESIKATVHSLLEEDFQKRIRAAESGPRE